MREDTRKVIKDVLTIIRDICIALLAVLTGSALVSSCGVTARTSVRTTEQGHATITVSVTSPQSYTTDITHKIDSSQLKIK